MAHKTLIGGTAYDTKGGRCLVGGTGYDVKKGRTLVGGTGYDVSFLTAVMIGDLAVGSSVYLNESGTPVEYLIVHHGNPDSTKYDSSCNGTWLLRKDAHSATAWSMSTNYTYNLSDIHDFLNNDILPLFDNDVQTAIQQVKIPYNKLNVAMTGANGLSTKIFLLSAFEVGFDHNHSAYLPASEGSLLDYFEYGVGASAKNRRVAYIGSATKAWWLRTQDDEDKSYAFMVNNDGTLRGQQVNITSSYCARPALIMDSTALFNSNTLEFVS